MVVIKAIIGSDVKQHSQHFNKEFVPPLDVQYDTIGENPNPTEPNARMEVRKHSHHEYKIFKKRWQEAAKEDESWVDPYPDTWNYSII
nr:hypothetical protein CTI12_AA432290 [Tanacetum cinerariifolium]